jgi:hypothetical protein
MAKWGFWDWVGYGVLFMAALVEAFNAALKSAPELSAAMPSFLTGPVIGFLPLLFILLATLILGLRALGLLPARATSRPEYVSPYAGKTAAPAHDMRDTADKIFPPTVTLWNPRGLFVGHMGMDTPKLETDFYVEIWAKVFNATGVAIAAHHIQGLVKYQDGDEKISLPAPQFRAGAAPKSVANNSEFMVVLEQRIPAEIVRKINAQLSAGTAANFDLNSLDIWLEPVGGPDERARLPIWNGMTLKKYQDRILVGQVTEIRMQAASLSIATSGFQSR